MQVELIVDKLVDVVTSIEPITYWRHDLLGELDSKLFDAVLDLYKGNAAARDLFVGLLDERSSHTLAIFSERMVSLGVIQQSQSCLIVGLYAICLTFRSRSENESFKLIALFYDAAQKLEIDGEALLEKIAVKAPDFAQPFLQQFLDLDDRTKMLEHFGFRYDPLKGHGLIYQRIKLSRVNTVASDVGAEELLHN